MTASQLQNEGTVCEQAPLSPPFLLSEQSFQVGVNGQGPVCSQLAVLHQEFCRPKAKMSDVET